MIGITRRTFNTVVGAASAVSALALTVGAARSARTGPSVVVVGGGFGGASAAKYLRRFDPSLQVTLIEPNKTFYTCPFSNLVLAGLRTMDSIGHSYESLRSKHGVNVVHDTVTAVDPVAKKLTLKGGGSMTYDRLVMSPGIDFKWGAVQGYDEAASERIPHAWKAGPQTILLRKQIETMDDGGLVIIVPPENPFRCPPGPYERAGLIAHYLKTNKPRSKILILDPKEKFSKQALFMEGWKTLYPGMIEWVPLSQDGTVERVDAKAMTVETEFGTKHKAAVINVIPPQKAGAIAHAAGVVDETEWCPVHQQTFESKIHKGIHVIGDASIAGAMPKSGFSASSQGKVVAAAIVALLEGRPPASPSLSNTCYSLIGPNYGISVAAVYRLKDDEIVSVEGAGGVSPIGAPSAFRKNEAEYAEGWYQSIASDMFG